MKPLIGITASYNSNDGRYFLPEAYLTSIVDAGGIPIILPSVMGRGNLNSYLEVLHGIVLSGGVDADPSFFGDEPSPMLGEITPQRDEFEIKLLKAAVKTNLPILGICRGAQMINIAFGGSLYQHISNKLEKITKHSQNAPRWYATHSVSIYEDSLLATIIGQGVRRVNSFHHQAIREVADGFIVSARSNDGIIEAIENPAYPFLIGVQWHPECMTAIDPKAKLLFRKFVECSRSVKKQKKSAK